MLNTRKCALLQIFTPCVVYTLRQIIQKRRLETHLIFIGFYRDFAVSAGITPGNNLKEGLSKNLTYLIKTMQHI